MKLLNAMLHVLSEGFSWSIAGGMMLAGIGGMTGALHGLLHSLLPIPSGQFHVMDSVLLSFSAAILGLVVGAVGGAVAINLSGIYHAVREEIRTVGGVGNDRFMECVAGAGQAAFYCSLGGAITGAMMTWLWPLLTHAAGTRSIEDSTLGYFWGAIFGFTFGTFVGALAPDFVEHLLEHTKEFWSVLMQKSRDARRASQ